MNSTFTVDAILNKRDEKDDCASSDSTSNIECILSNSFLKSQEMQKSNDGTKSPIDKFRKRISYPTEISNSKKKQRNLFSKSQTSILRQYFNKKNYISASEREALSISTNLSPEQIKIWFQNNRYKMKNSYNYRSQQQMNSNPNDYNPSTENLIIDNYNNLYRNGKSFNSMNPFCNNWIQWNKPMDMFGFEKAVFYKTIKETSPILYQLNNLEKQRTKAQWHSDWM